MWKKHDYIMKLNQALNNSSLKFNSFSSEKGYSYKVQTKSIFGKMKKSLVDMILLLGVILPMLW